MQQSSLLSCTVHSKQIMGVCIQQKCQNIRPSCLECLKQFHQDHINDVIEIDSLNIQIKRNSTKITQWLLEIESLVQILRNCFESLLTENSVNDFTNSHALHDFIQKQMNNQKINMEVVQTNFQNVKQSLQILSESIFNRTEKQFEESDKLKQVKLLISQQGLHQSLQETKNFIQNRRSSQIEQEAKIEQLMDWIFQNIIFIDLKSQIFSLDQNKFKQYDNQKKEIINMKQLLKKKQDTDINEILQIKEKEELLKLQVGECSNCFASFSQFNLKQLLECKKHQIGVCCLKNFKICPQCEKIKKEENGKQAKKQLYRLKWPEEQFQDQISQNGLQYLNSLQQILLQSMFLRNQSTDDYQQSGGTLSYNLSQY